MKNTNNHKDRITRKRSFGYLQQAHPISLHLRVVWSESSLTAVGILGLDYTYSIKGKFWPALTHLNVGALHMPEGLFVLKLAPYEEYISFNIAHTELTFCMWYPIQHTTNLWCFSRLFFLLKNRNISKRQAFDCQKCQVLVARRKHKFS